MKTEKPKTTAKDKTNVSKKIFNQNFCSFPLTSVSKSEEESVEEVGEPVSIVLNDIDPE